MPCMLCHAGCIHRWCLARLPQRQLVRWSGNSVLLCCPEDMLPAACQWYRALQRRHQLIPPLQQHPPSPHLIGKPLPHVRLAYPHVAPRVSNTPQMHPLESTFHSSTQTPPPGHLGLTHLRTHPPLKTALPSTPPLTQPATHLPHHLPCSRSVSSGQCTAPGESSSRRVSALAWLGEVPPPAHTPQPPPPSCLLPVPSPALSLPNHLG